MRNFMRWLFRNPISRRISNSLKKMVGQAPAPLVINVAVNPARPLLDMVRTTDFSDPVRHDFNARTRSDRQARDRRKPLTINWLVPEPLSGGSGGHMNIFQFARQFQLAGHHNRLYSIPNFHLASDAAMRELIERYYCDLAGAETLIDSRTIQPADITVATAWDTAYRLYDLKSTLFKVYLVQDFEPYFYSMGTHYIIAENTYRMNYFGLFLGPWLKERMAAEYGFQGLAFPCSIDFTRYRPLPNATRDPDLVAVYVRPRTSRRGFELVIEALTRLKEVRPATRIVLFGADERILGLPFDCEQTGIVDEQGLCGLYNRATVVLLTSLTNYSIVPGEAMACGAVVVDVNMPSIRAVFKDGEHILLAEPNPPDMAKLTARALDDAGLRTSIVATSRSYIKSFEGEKVRIESMNGLEAAFYA